MQQVDGKLECGGVFVAEDADQLAVLGDHLQVEGLHGHIQHLISHAHLIQLQLLLVGLGPGLRHGHHMGDDVGLLEALHLGVGIQHSTQQHGVPPGQESQEDEQQGLPTEVLQVVHAHYHQVLQGRHY